MGLLGDSYGSVKAVYFIFPRKFTPQLYFTIALMIASGAMEIDLMEICDES